MDKVSALRQKYNLVIDSPFVVEIGGAAVEFEIRVRGYGAPHGMIVDSVWRKIEPVANELVAHGFGFSCFDLLGDDDIDGFQKVLDDWGKCPD